MENIVTSKDNPSIKLYQKLSSSKKERFKYGLFVLEGVRIVEEVIKEASGLLTHLICTKSAYDKISSTIFLHANLRNTKMIVTSNELGNKISSTHTTQGIFAICRIPVKCEMQFLPNGRYIVLYGLQDPGNLGMIIRTADALGINGVILSGRSCDLYNPKVIRATMGSFFRVAIHIANDINSLFKMLKNCAVITYAAVVDTIDAIHVTDCCFTTNAHAVFIGNEGNGLPIEITMRCDRHVTIPMNGTINSLNSAMAAGIIMWELRKQ